MHPDVLLYLIYESIRGDWSEAIEERGNAIIDLLPHTTFNDKTWMKTRMEQMITGWKTDREWFDGRSVARDGKYCYYTLFKDFATLENLNSSPYLTWGRSDDGSDRLEHNRELTNGCHDDVMELYMAWKEETCMK